MRVKRRKELLSLSNFRFLLLLLLLFVSAQEIEGFKEHRCKTLDIRNNPLGKNVPKDKKEEVRQKNLDLNCTVIEGSFLMSMVGNDNKTLTRDDFPCFENLREVTGSVLIFQVAGLRSLKWLFPNLRVIGGHNLIQHYSLIIYQNHDLEELGLDNLRVIRNGGVRSAENSRLCNAKAINWRKLQFGTINDVLVDDSSEISVGEGSIEPCIDTCLPNDENRCLKSEKGISCWSKNSCQLGCDHDRNHTNGQVGPGCSDDTWDRCHDECIAGCSRPDDPRACYACAHVSHEGRCMAKCPANLYSYMDRRCVDKITCEGLDPRKSAGQIDTYKAFNGRCHYHCPDHYEEDPSNNKTCRHCGNDCIRKCQGNITVDSLSRARSLEKCTVIDGHLEIEMRIGMESVAASELTKAFGKIQMIDGYLLIRLTPSFVNLHMFKSLHTITGRYLYRDKYAVSVYENANLQKLFPTNPFFNVSAGFLQFQNNRMLCFDHITAFMKSLGRYKEMDEFDQSRNSNGDKAICSESSFNVTVNEVSSTSFQLKWKAFNTTDIDYRKFLGYEVKYKEVEKPDESMSIDDDRSACSDSWNSFFLEVKTSVNDVGHIQAAEAKKDDVMVEIANDMIKPNTYYAFYVTTSMVRHEGALNAVSRIGFLRTNFGTPDPPVLREAREKGTDTIYLQWDPPVRPNGEITHYVVTYKPQAQDPLKFVDETGDGCYEGRREEDRSKESLDIDGRAREITADDPTTLSPGQQSLLSTVAPPDTCAASGCCSCPADPKTTSQQRQETSDFENALQDTIFVQNCEINWNPIHCESQNPSSPSTRKRSVDWERRRRSIYRSEHPIRNTIAAEDIEVEIKRKKRSILRSSQDKDNNDRLDAILNKIEKNEALNEPTKTNVSGTNITLTKLYHYTYYFISISACQNRSAIEHHCSQRKAWKHVHTKGIQEADLVDNKTIAAEVVNGTDSGQVNITWEAPKSPNGLVRSYEVAVINLDTKATPIKQCKGALSNWSPNQGIVFSGLTNGNYRVEIRTRSLLPKMSEPSYSDELFSIHIPGFWTPDRILLATGLGLVLLLLFSLLSYCIFRRYYGKRMFVRAMQLISANPEYLSQQDVYKPDEWELPRNKLAVGECIGKGTFGQVYKGTGQNIQSFGGDIFGECAIKTVTEGANSSERIHFLLEASVMKKFDSSHIVKLYGVVSDGQPVYVVMEFMYHGNLRDYLRSRRPEDELNKDGSLPPKEDELLRWAIQIADGMAYLESLRFCHRDLAARNCMVSRDLIVKIGDFGMTRDLCYREYYKPTGRRMMPVRWMAPESLVDGRHDIKSDVWSYGVVLYEMMTLGQQPYQGLANDEIIEYIARKRKIMEEPLNCYDQWYSIMKECWEFVPRERPDFFQLVEDLSEMSGAKKIDLGTFNQTSFVYKNPDLAPLETNYTEDENPYQPDPLSNFLNGFGDNFIGRAARRKQNRRNEAKPGWGEGQWLQEQPAPYSNGVSEHSV